MHPLISLFSIILVALLHLETLQDLHVNDSHFHKQVSKLSNTYVRFNIKNNTSLPFQEFSCYLYLILWFISCTCNKIKCKWGILIDAHKFHCVRAPHLQQWGQLYLV